MPIVLDGTQGISTPMYAGSISSNPVTPSVNMKNRIINGNFVIDQRNAGASVNPSTDGIYTLDRWVSWLSVSGKYTIQQNAGSVTPPAGYINYLGVTSSSAYTPSSTQYFGVAQYIEGLNVADLGWGTANAQTITVSFWVRSSLTGTFGGVITNSAYARSYPFTYTISSANTWEQKSVTIAGDTTGTWLTNTSAGLRLVFSFGMGSSVQGTPNTWQAGSFYAPNTETRLISTNGATWYVTGVQLEIGSTATSFDYRPYGTELALCQRYFYTLIRGTGYFVNAYYYSSSNLSATIQFPNQMRATPTLTVNSGTNYYVFYRNGGNDGVNGFSISSPSQTSSGIENTTEASGTAGQAGGIYADNANCFIGFSAEL